MLVPVTVKFKGFAVVGERPVTVTKLDPPTAIEAGLKVHVAPELQAREIFPRNVLGPAAAIVKDAVLVPMRTTLDRWFEESEKTGLPVPVKATAVAVFTAFDVTVTLPVWDPVLLGVKFTATVQL